jgi:hypothetical protein
MEAVSEEVMLGAASEEGMMEAVLEVVMLGVVSEEGMMEAVILEDSIIVSMVVFL